MKEIKIFGRGGQGAVMASQILATAAFLQGQWAQTFPQYGAERRGAPVIAYVRLNHEPIHDRSKVYSPDEVIVMDLTLFKMMNPVADLKTEGVILVNSPDNKELPKDVKGKKVFAVDASSIAHRIYGKTPIPITNIVILGAYSRIGSDPSLEFVLKALSDFFPEEKLALNAEAARMGFARVREIR